MKKQNLIGQKFNQLTVLSEDIEKTKKYKRSYWICKCDCGQIKSVRGSSLTSGAIKSCGCLNKKKIKDIKNQRFGKLIALEMTSERQGGAVIWKCQCDCGNIIYVPVNRLTSRNTQSCGCIKYSQNNSIDFSGQRFGKLTVLKKYNNYKDKFNRSLWECQCDCGSKIIVPGPNLKTTYSCGCSISKGEETIATILKLNNINFEKEKTFDTCRFPDTKALARFDFYLPDYNILIEYDGKQHFTGWNNNLQDLDNIQKRDSYKNQWSKEHKIILIRIPYTIDKIEIQDLLNNSQFII